MTENEKGAAPPKPVCVVLDTNVWVYDTGLLRSPLGAALTHALMRSQAVLGMPEVVEDEIVKHAVKAGRESVDRIRSGFSRLARLTGSESEYEDLVPPDDTLESGARERLRELDALTVRIPFTLEHAKSALQRVNDGTPPNGPKNQQFKDSAIWEAALDLSREYDVHLVTQDNAFFQNRKPDKGLARNLMEDCEAEGGSVTAHPDLRSCLEAIKEGVPSLDPQELAAAADRAVMGELRETAEAQEFELGDLESYNVSAFLTEKTHVLALSFELTYEAALAVTGQEQPVDAVVIATGDCSFDMRESTASDVRLSRLTLIDQEDGQLPGKGVQYVCTQDLSSLVASGVGSGRTRSGYLFKREASTIS